MNEAVRELATERGKVAVSLKPLILTLINVGFDAASGSPAHLTDVHVANNKVVDSHVRVSDPRSLFHVGFLKFDTLVSFSPRSL